MGDRMTAEEKQELLIKNIERYETVAVAYSGGTDSSYLLAAARMALGDKAVAVMAISPSMPAADAREAEEYCRSKGIRLITVEPGEIHDPNYRTNPNNRCYYCKTILYRSIRRAAEEAGCREILEGSNLDDLGDYRPGLKALEELGIKSPLREVGLSKREIRELSNKLGLRTWDKPAAACLASRIPYGEEITEEKLRRIGAVEEKLHELGFRQARCRMHGGNLARIEVLETEIEKLAQEPVRTQVLDAARDAGFLYVSLDLRGYRTGSLNEAIGESKS